MKRIVTVVLLLAVAMGVTSSTAWAVEPQGKLSKARLHSLIVNAKTPADHQKLANYYRYEASTLQASVKEHEEMAADYDKNPVMRPLPKFPNFGEHCRNLVKSYSEGVKEANEMAAMHEEMANAAK